MFEEIFHRYTFDSNRLLNYGFHLEGDSYHYQVELFPQAFRMDVEVKSNGEVSFSLWDLEMDELYSHVFQEELQGQFVSQVREACRKVLVEIREACFYKEVFRSDKAKELLKRTESEWGVTPDFLWERNPDAAALRHLADQKWFAVLMRIDWSKLDVNKSGLVEVLNVKSQVVGEALKRSGVYPAYHMNKKYWLSLPLEGSLSDEELWDFLSTSYQVTKK